MSIYFSRNSDNVREVWLRTKPKWTTIGTEGVPRITGPTDQLAKVKGQYLAVENNDSSISTQSNQHWNQLLDRVWVLNGKKTHQNRLWGIQFWHFLNKAGQYREVWSVCSDYLLSIAPKHTILIYFISKLGRKFQGTIKKNRDGVQGLQYIHQKIMDRPQLW